MKSLLTIMITLITWNVHADDVCSTADQQLKYVQNDIERGQPPRNGDLLYTESITYKGSEQGTNHIYKGLDNRPVFNMVWDTNSYNKLDSKPIPGGISETYTIYLKYVQVGMPGLGKVIEVEKTMICQQDLTFVP